MHPVNSVFLPECQLAPAGYADPAAALETALWAMSRGDATALAASVTPEARSKLIREDWLQHGPAEEELAAATRIIADSLSPSSGFYVVGQVLVSQDQATLDLHFEGEQMTRKVALKSIGDGWKLDTLGNGAWP